MKKDVLTVIVGGEAGQGIKKAAETIAGFFNNLNRNVFQIIDYPSLIRGGHNFCVISSSTQKIRSHYMKADIVVAIDKRSYEFHKEHVADNGVMIYDSSAIKEGIGIGIPIDKKANSYENSNLIKGVAGIAALAAAVGLAKDKLKQIIEIEYAKGVEDNINFAFDIYEAADKKIHHKFKLKRGEEQNYILDGNQCIALGAAAAGLDVYFAYPMTPASGLLHFLAQNVKELGLVAVHAESEIAVANMAIGSAFTGARTMVGTSGGGFCLMQEAFSLAGMCEAPVLFNLSQRSGPSTGVPTYTEQADILMALYPGQGEFSRIVASPGSLEEAFYLTAEMLELVWRFQTPAVLLSEKHLVESSQSISLDPSPAKWAEPAHYEGGEYKRYRDTDNGISPLLFPPSEATIKWNSYEHDEAGLTTEKAEQVTQMHDKRNKKQENLIEYMKKLNTVNVYGKGKSVIFTLGSTTMSVLEALEYGDISATVVQPIYLNPFPIWELQSYSNCTSAIVIEQNSTGQLQSLLTEKAGIKFKDSIRKYDGRPFDPITLAKQLKKVL